MWPDHVKRSLILTPSNLILLTYYIDVPSIDWASAVLEPMTLHFVLEKIN